jgi:excinuclease UvrABC ATPase subunit
MAYPTYGSITIRGARENNLKNVSLDIPKRRITVFTGVSGSGKPSLVFSTIAAESRGADPSLRSRRTVRID